MRSAEILLGKTAVYRLYDVAGEPRAALVPYTWYAERSADNAETPSE
jgi:hypothetical protein